MRSMAVRLLGRERECAAIDALLAAASVGTSGTLVLRGEAGIGKSALVRHRRRAMGRPAVADALAFTGRRLRAERVAILAGARSGEGQGFRAEGLPELLVTGLDSVSAASLLADAGHQVPAEIRERLLAEAAGKHRPGAPQRPHRRRRSGGLGRGPARTRPAGDRAGAARRHR
jgi:AAA ATPase domain